ncbi:unnamed protein product [Penicillium salamii]|uniref:Uncharacterized protein n=1 Tax=Penicillium salamii TaxID=1612424 RepID=A0A9W4NZ39_9EURO|nr:unnamed protein product [Penicillium salamii]CAG8108170.1 unnamed protein product [Penicillium salamii]CAG8141354.1 unnamed protein product [Penicillium salamii]CAG8176256.1 unnamed protein product [Penicillium salamii]CAG8346786.1 unnamed protein product [Penicillium salamii]
MSGNYDYPFSSRMPTPRRPDLLRLQNLRNLVAERNRAGASTSYHATRALETLNQEIVDHQLDRTRDRSNLEQAHFEQARAAVDRQIQQLQSELASPAERIQHIRYNQLRSERPPSRFSPESHSRRRSVPWPTLAPSPGASRSPSLMPPSGQSGHDDQGRQKRRKLDTDDERIPFDTDDGCTPFKGFNYGLYGQVLPGELKMSLLTCDGGEIDPNGVRSLPENILKNDQSIYSSKEDRCTLVMCHKNETPFCLKKIVIRGPSQCSFDAPIQEGMVFVAMSTDDPFTRTAESHMQYSSRWRRRPRRSGLPPSEEYLSGFRPPLQNIERTILTGPDSHYPLDISEDPRAQFRITTEYHENKEDNAYSDNEEEAPLEFSTQEEPAERYTSDTDDTPSDEDDMHYLRRRVIQNQHRAAVNRHSENRSRREPSLVPSNSDDSTPPPTDVLKPLARFFLERERNIVTIKFDPPPSGRYILIKLWSPYPHEGSINIESIIAHGYAGPRFFPSITAR